MFVYSIRTRNVSKIQMTFDAKSTCRRCRIPKNALFLCYSGSYGGKWIMHPKRLQITTTHKTNFASFSSKDDISTQDLVKELEIRSGEIEEDLLPSSTRRNLSIHEDQRLWPLIWLWKRWKHFLLYIALLSKVPGNMCVLSLVMPKRMRFKLAGIFLIRFFILPSINCWGDQNA